MVSVDISRTTQFENNSDGYGRRVRLRPRPGGMTELINNAGAILAPIKDTNGMVWPYQPSINYSQTVDYTQVQLTHTNQDFYAFARSPTPELTVEGEFTVQNQGEGLYALACIHFLRTVTKMYFGLGDNLGVPPPILLFDAYGQYMFNKLPVIVTAFTANMVKEVDYVAVNVGSNFLGQTAASLQNSNLVRTNATAEGYVWLPSIFNISVTMKIQNTPSRLQKFDLNEFRNGNLLKSGGGWI